MKNRIKNNQSRMSKAFPVFFATLVLAVGLILISAMTVSSLSFVYASESNLVGHSAYQCNSRTASAYPANASSQFEDSPCHIFIMPGNILDINYTLDGGPDAPSLFYNNMLIIPMSQPMGLIASNQQMPAQKPGALPVINNFPFMLPSYTPPSNWSTIWGRLAAYNATTGIKIWEDRLPAPVMSQPILVRNTIYISTGADFVNSAEYLNGIYAINATTGAFIWNVSTVSEHMPTPVFYNGSLIIVPGEGNPVMPDDQYLYALNSSTGEPLWRLFVGGESAMSSPALVGNTIYFGVRMQPYGTIVSPQKTALVAVSLATRKILWEDFFNASLGTEDSSPSASDNIVVSGYATISSNGTSEATQTDNLYLVAANATTGKILWKFNEGIGIRPPRSVLPATTIYNGLVYSDSATVGTLYAVNLTTGKEAWSYRTFLSEPNPLPYKGYILDINQTGTLFVFNATTGKLVNLVNLYLAMGWCGTSELQIVGNSLVVGGENNKLDILPLSSIL